MADEALPRVDWVKQFEVLDPYIGGRGGLFHVHAPPGAPVNLFTRAVHRHLVGTCKRTMRVVRIAPSDADTRYLLDIVKRIAVECDIELKPVVSTPHSATIGSNLSASSVHISNSNITQDLHPTLMDHIHSLRVGLRSFLKQESLALIMLESHRYSKRGLSLLSTLLWDGCLKEHTGNGLLVVDVFNPRRMAAKSNLWPPSPDGCVSISNQYAESELDGVRGDLMAIAMNRGLFREADEALVFAQTLIAASPDIESLHSSLSMALRRMEYAS